MGTLCSNFDLVVVASENENNQLMKILHLKLQMLDLEILSNFFKSVISSNLQLTCEI